MTELDTCARCLQVISTNKFNGMCIASSFARRCAIKIDNTLYEDGNHFCGGASTINRDGGIVFTIGNRATPSDIRLVLHKDKIISLLNKISKESELFRIEVDNVLSKIF